MSCRGIGQSNWTLVGESSNDNWGIYQLALPPAVESTLAGPRARARTPQARHKNVNLPDHCLMKRVHQKFTTEMRQNLPINRRLGLPFPRVNESYSQVDGDSEFTAAFEQACQQRGLRLFVLPPRSPKLNGAVERAQRTRTEEFYRVTPMAENLQHRAPSPVVTYSTATPSAVAYRTKRLNMSPILLDEVSSLTSNIFLRIPSESR
jgi:hypothetical protein